MRPLGGYPKVTIANDRHSPASYTSFYGGITRWLGIAKQIRLGNWDSRNLFDEIISMDEWEFLLLCVNEETLHWVLDEQMGKRTCASFDELTFELRRFLQS